MIKRIFNKIKRIFNKNKVKYKTLLFNFIFRKKYQNDLDKILRQNNNNLVFISLPVVDWNIPLFQRPQHIASNISNLNCLYFYCTNNESYDNIFGFQKINDSCYITNQISLVMNLKNTIFHLYSTDKETTYKDVQNILDNENKVVYDYIDDIHDALSGKIPEHTIEKHKKILQNENCYVIATAQILFDEVLQNRKNNCRLVTNGVDFDHFSKKHTTIPDKIMSVNSNKIIGYFGALASWFDYDLIKFIAKNRPEYHIVIIGWDYDGSIDKHNLNSYSNIHYLGAINYFDLPLYASHFNVSMIPFIINDLTKATSPIKLFEYMALGHPIVTTNMDECSKYKSVMVANSHDEFLNYIDKAFTLENDNNYIDLLKQEGLNNTWQQKSKDIIDLINCT